MNLGEMMEAVPSVRSFKFHEELVLRYWKNHQVREKTKKFLEDTGEVVGEEQVTSFLTEMKALDRLSTKRDNFNLKETIMNMYDKAVSGKVAKGLMTGYKDYDLLTNGHGKGQFIIIAARPSVGKTAFALNIAAGHTAVGEDRQGEGSGEFTAGEGKEVFGHLYSLEMTKDQFLQRMVAAEGRIHSQKLRDPVRRFDASDWERYSGAMDKLSKKNLFICDRSNVRVPEIYANTKRLMEEYPDMDHFIIIDYLQLLRPISKRGSRQEEVAEISRALKTMARDLEVPVIALSQLSRSVESRRDKRPTLADLRESGSLEQDADVVAFLYREDYYDRDTENRDEIEIIVAKQREGPVGTVELLFLKEYNLFAGKEEGEVPG
ncbi:replicative DNA helicase [Evansella vedderi]|uniref:Replicative DNA helicase n=1 Tax=Evansella vedderi TaxID=38282 RepID=A0ABT9ZTC0_9BACI|nr:replicative DNA helicase [Evansella vedderi]